MNEFLLFALVTVYLAICYVPISGEHSSNGQGHQHEISSETAIDPVDDEEFGSS